MSKTSDRINAAMLHRNKNQAWLVKHTNLTKSAVSQIVSGETKSPNAENIFIIADALDYEARWLATGEGPKTKEDSARDRLDLSDFPANSRARIHAIADALKKSDLEEKAS